MKDDRYRQALADIYRFVETYEEVPPGKDEEYWERLVDDLKNIDKKYGNQVIREWLIGILEGFQTAWENAHSTKEAHHEPRRM